MHATFVAWLALQEGGQAARRVFWEGVNGKPSNRSRGGTARLRLRKLLRQRGPAARAWHKLQNQSLVGHQRMVAKDRMTVLRDLYSASVPDRYNQGRPWIVEFQLCECEKISFISSGLYSIPFIVIEPWNFGC